VREDEMVIKNVKSIAFERFCGKFLDNLMLILPPVIIFYYHMFLL